MIPHRVGIEPPPMMWEARATKVAAVAAALPRRARRCLSLAFTRPFSHSRQGHRRHIVCPSAVGGASAAAAHPSSSPWIRSEEHTSELQSRGHLVCRLLLEKKKTNRH